MTTVGLCEACGGQLEEIVYGEPRYEVLTSGTPVHLAGCEIPEHPRSHRCRDCGLEVGEWAG